MAAFSMRADPSMAMQDAPSYSDPVDEIYRWLEEGIIPCTGDPAPAAAIG